MPYDQLTRYSTIDKKGWHKTDNLPQRFGLLQYGKQIAKRPVFWRSPLTFASNIKTLAWVKAINFANKWSIWSPTVISEPWTPRFWPCRTLDWLDTLLLTKKLNGKSTNYHSSLASFAMATNIQTPGILVLVSLLGIHFLFNVTQLNVFFCFLYEENKLWQ